MSDELQPGGILYFHSHTGAAGWWLADCAVTEAVRALRPACLGVYVRRGVFAAAVKTFDGPVLRPLTAAQEAAARQAFARQAAE